MKDDKLLKSIEKIRELSKDFDKGDPFIPELLEDIKELKAKMQFILDEDTRKKWTYERLLLMIQLAELWDVKLEDILQRLVEEMEKMSIVPSEKGVDTFCNPDHNIPYSPNTKTPNLSG